MGSRPRLNLFAYSALSVIRGAANSTSAVLWVVFLQRQHSLSLTEVTILDVVFWIGKFLFEIPTGVVADRYGRKLSLTMGAAIGSLSWVGFALFKSFPMLCVAQFVGAFAATFDSGASEAILYESTEALGRKSAYASISARMKAIETASCMIAGLGVGLLAMKSLVTPVLLTALLLAFSLIPILMLKETIRKRPTVSRTPYIQIVREALTTFQKVPVVRLASAYLLVIGSVAFYVEMFLQPYAIMVGLSIAMLGPVMVGYQILGIAGSLSVGLSRKLFGTRSIVLIAPFLLAPSLFAIGVLRGSSILPLFGFSSILFSLFKPLLFQLIQDNVSSNTRATVLSMQSLLFTFFLVPTEPALGLLSDHYGVAASYLAMAGLVFGLCLPLLFVARKHLKKGKA